MTWRTILAFATALAPLIASILDFVKWCMEEDE